MQERNLSAMQRLAEGMEETLSLHAIGVFALLSISFKTTNCIESVNPRIERCCGRISHWKNSRQKHRWLAAALLDIEPRLSRVNGYKNLPKLRQAIML